MTVAIALSLVSLALNVIILIDQHRQRKRLAQTRAKLDAVDQLRAQERALRREIKP